MHEETREFLEFTETIKIYCIIIIKTFDLILTFNSNISSTKQKGSKMSDGMRNVNVSMVMKEVINFHICELWKKELKIKADKYV